MNFTNKIKSWFKPNFGGKVIHDPFSGAWQRNLELQQEDILLQSTIFSCINLISSDIAKIRPRIIEQQDSGIWKETWDSVYSPILKNPNNFQNHLQFKEMWMLSKLTCGNTYCLIQRDRKGKPERLYILDPHLCKPCVSPNGDVFYELQLDKLNVRAEYLDLIAVEERLLLPASEIIHDRWNCFYHPLCGIAPLQSAMLDAKQALKIQRHSSDFFENSAMMSGILTAPGQINDDTAKRAKEYFESEFTGSGAGKIAVLGDGLAYEKMSMSSTDAQLIEQMKYTTEKICGIFHVPQYMISGNAPTQSNIEIMNQQYYSQCLQILIESFEECIDNAFGFNQKERKNIGVELDLHDIMRMDTTTRYSNYDKGIKGSFLTINEARLKENLEAVEGGDTIWMQQQNYSLKALMERDKNNPLVVVPSASTQPEETSQEDKETTKNEEVLEVIEEVKRLKDKIKLLEENQLNFDIIDDIDDNISYEKNTLAMYKGGLIKAKEQTKKLSEVEETEAPFDKISNAGWQVLVNGSNGHYFEFDEQEKSLTIKSFYTDYMLTKHVELPIICDKGIFDIDVKYKKGDAVTYAGSLWICVENCSNEIPKGSENWRLSVKNGGRNVSNT